MDKEEQKQIMKEAFQEWLDSKYAAVGKWTISGVGAFLIGAILYFIATHQGWK